MKIGFLKLPLKAKLIKFSILTPKLRFINGNFKSFCSFNDKIKLGEVENSEKLKEKLLKLSLININKYGWSEESIKHASNELGYSNVS